MAVPKLKYFIQCDEVRNDGGKFSALGLFDTIFSLIFPATHRRFFLLLGFVGGEGEYDVELHITAPDGNSMGQAKGKLHLASPEQVGNVVFAFENLPLPSEGRYTLSLFLDGDFCAEHYFNVRPPVARRKRTPEEIAALLKDPDIIKSANADVQCDKCRAVYRFQLQLDPAAPVDPGFLRIPPGDFFACGGCGRHIPITQVRQNLENIVGISRRLLEPHYPPQQPPPPPAGGAGGAGGQG